MAPPVAATTTGRGTGPGPDEVDFTWLVEGVRRLEAWVSRHRLSREGIVLGAGSLVAVAMAAWLTSGGWGGRPLSGDDTMGHVVRAQFAYRNLISQGRLDGWDPSFILGYQAFLFIGAGFTWAVAVLHAVSLGMLSITGAVKVVGIGSFVLAPIAVAFLARSFGLSGRSAGLAAVLSLAVNSPFGGVGLQGLFNVGLLPHQFAALFFFVALGGSVRLLRGGSRRWVVLTALATAALLMSHGISVIIFGAMLAVVLLASSVSVPTVEAWRQRKARVVRRAVAEELRRLGLTSEGPAEPPEEPTTVLVDRPARGSLGQLFVAFAVAGGLAACVLLPFWGHRVLRGIFTSWTTPPLGDRLSEIWRGEVLYQPGVAGLVLLGMLYGIVRVAQGRSYALPLVATPFLYVVGSHVAFNLWPSSVVTPQLTNRGLGYAGVLAILPFAALIARATRGLSLPGDALALAIAAGVVLVPVTPYRAFARQSAEPIPQLRDAARQLRVLVPEGSRFATERDFPEEISRTKVVNPDRWLAWASGRYTLNNFNVESSQSPGAAYQGEHILDRPPATIADALSKLGTTHLVTVSEEGARHIGASPRFSLAWRAAPIAIYAVVPPPGHPNPAALLAATSPVEATLVKAEPEHITIDVRSDQAVPATVAVGWSPKWHARLDGRSLPLTKSPEGMLALRLPAGAHRLQLDFRSDAWDWAGLLVTLSTVGLGGAWLVRTVRRRTSQPEEATA